MIRTNKYIYRNSDGANPSVNTYTTNKNRTYRKPVYIEKGVINPSTYEKFEAPAGNLPTDSILQHPATKYITVGMIMAAITYYISK